LREHTCTGWASQPKNTGIANPGPTPHANAGDAAVRAAA